MVFLHLKKKLGRQTKIKTERVKMRWKIERLKDTQTLKNRQNENKDGHHNILLIKAIIQMITMSGEIHSKTKENKRRSDQE